MSREQRTSMTTVEQSWFKISHRSLRPRSFALGRREDGCKIRPQMRETRSAIVRQGQKRLTRALFLIDINQIWGRQLNPCQRRRPRVASRIHPQRLQDHLIVLHQWREYFPWGWVLLRIGVHYWQRNLSRRDREGPLFHRRRIPPYSSEKVVSILSKEEIRSWSV